MRYIEHAIITHKPNHRGSVKHNATIPIESATRQIEMVTFATHTHAGYSRLSTNFFFTSSAIFHFKTIKLFIFFLFYYFFNKQIQLLRIEPLYYFFFSSCNIFICLKQVQLERAQTRGSTRSLLCCAKYIMYNTNDYGELSPGPTRACCITIFILFMYADI